MKNLRHKRKLSSFALIIFCSITVLAQTELPAYGKIDDIRGKSKVYIVADNIPRTFILEEVKKSKLLINVDDPELAEFVMRYKMTHRREPGYPIPLSTEAGQMDVVLTQNGKTIIAWRGDADSPLVRGKHPSKELIRRFLKELAKVNQK